MPSLSLSLVALLCFAAEPSSTPAADPAASQPKSRRAVAPLGEKSQQTLAFGRTIGAKGRPIENAEALAAFFAHLDALANKQATESLKIVTFGNSLISADNVTNTVRERLSERFGDGGRGLVLIDRFANYGPRTRTGFATPGHWNAFNFAIGEKGRGIFGIGGAVHEANVGAVSEWRLKNETRAELWWLDRKDGEAFDFKVDGTTAMHVVPERSGAAKRTVVSLPEGAKRLQLVAPKGKMSAFGMIVERTTPGVVFDTIGIPAAEASHYVKLDEAISLDQIAARKPSLLVFMLGGNEIRRLSWVRGAKAEQRRQGLENDLQVFIERMKKGAPDASCLVVGPIDAVYNNADSPMKLKTRPQTDEINAMERKVAGDKGCAFFDMYAAMGGKGSLSKFFDHGMLQEDLVHPKGRGFELLGELFADALLKAYVETPASPEELAARTR